MEEESLTSTLLRQRSSQRSHFEGPSNHSHVPDQNILTKLLHRSISTPSPPQVYHRERSFYQSLVPNYTESHVQVPSGYLRKFSPDGNLLLGFSSDQKSVIVYSYMGAGAAQQLYCDALETDKIRQEIFGKFFRTKHMVPIPFTNENLNRECSLFTDDCRYVLVGSSVNVQDDPYPSMYDLYQNNESVSANGRYQVEDYTLYMIDMKAGVVADSTHFKCDKIYLSHNQGVSLCGSLLAILSIQHQTVYMFLVENGFFIPVQHIGRFCYPDDALICSAVKYTTKEGRTEQVVKPFHEKWYTSLKQRLLTWLLKDAEKRCTPDNKLPVMQYFYKFNLISELKLWKMQLLDSDHLLLKFASEDVVTQKSLDPMSQPALIAVYNMHTTEFQSVFENTSDELLKLYEENADHFRVPVSHPMSCDVSSVANDRHARALHMKFKQTITNARYGGKTEATRRLLGQLPVCSQCHSSSPYLDLALFSYDDKWVSTLERPKNVADNPIRFFNRSSGQLCFALNLETGLPQPPPTQSRRLVAYIFHPHEPFVISIQKAGYSDYVVCFHFRNTQASRKVKVSK